MRAQATPSIRRATSATGGTAATRRTRRTNTSEGARATWRPERSAAAPESSRAACCGKQATLMSSPPKPGPFAKVDPELNFPKEEREILAIWKDKRIFERSMEQTKDRPRFVFYEGPPTANAMPHNRHVLARA